MSKVDKPRNCNPTTEDGAEGRTKQPEVWEVAGCGRWNQGREAGHGIGISRYQSFSTL